jgi:hypothetical protein
MATTVTLKPNAIDLSGSTSGTTTLQATAVAGTTTITLPAATDTLVGKATTDTLTNKTLTTPVISSLSSASATALTLQSAGTTAITVTTAQNVGIGTTSPSDFGAGFRMLAVSGSSTGILQTINSTDSVTTEMESESSRGAIGTRTNHPLVFKTNQTERARLNTTGALVLAGGSTSASGIGIAFPATQSASSDANTLDDYEEGTWTPTDGSGAGLTFTNIQAFYTKVGRMVTLNASFTFPSTASSAGIGISGAPFTYNFSNAENCATIFDYAGLGANQVYFAATSFDIRAAGSGTVRANSTFSLKRVHLMVSYSTSA